jgi:hypothetical protein
MNGTTAVAHRAGIAALRVVYDLAHLGLEFVDLLHDHRAMHSQQLAGFSAAPACLAYLLSPGRVRGTE